MEAYLESKIVEIRHRSVFGPIMGIFDGKQERVAEQLTERIITMRRIIGFKPVPDARREVIEALHDKIFIPGSGILKRKAFYFEEFHIWGTRTILEIGKGIYCYYYGILRGCCLDCIETETVISDDIISLLRFLPSDELLQIYKRIRAIKIIQRYAFERLYSPEGIIYRKLKQKYPHGMNT